ncbi:hypothetical protein [Streptomyces sp. NPDC002952]|uniref:hypothetical protein n=1 Tax=Streptomyces sp. NPDC002952 TaxID=3364673 RepID=UPI00369E04E1
MNADGRPSTITRNGRTLVSRSWIQEHTGAGAATVRLWYAKRATQPEDVRHPDKAETVDRVDYYDLEQFEKFYAWHQDSKKKRLLPTDQALYTGSPEDWLSINEATTLFHFAGPGVIRKYLKDNPGYFPDPVGTVEGPSGRQIPAFRRGDLQDFDRKRTGDNTGRAGSPGGPRPSYTTTEVQRRVDIAAAFLDKAGPARRGHAAELAELHGESVSKWERAVHIARLQRGDVRMTKEDRVATALAYLREHGYRRGVAAELAERHSEPERTWQTAVKDARLRADQAPDGEPERAEE